MEPTCFVICPIGKEGSEIRKRADILFDLVIEPSCDKFNLKPLRADKIATTGIITTKVIRHLRDAEIVIADLTGHNPNVFYELGIRHSLRKPAILIKSAIDTKPFDIQNINIIEYNSLEDQQEIKGLKRRVQDFLSSIIQCPDELDEPLGDMLSEYFAEEAGLTHTLSKIQKDICGVRDLIVNNLDIEGIDKNRINAQYLDGEDRAFDALTEATKRAKKEIRSSRFFPDSVLGQQEYVNAIESRVKGTDGKRELDHYFRIVALNNPDKLTDIIHHLTMFKGRPFTLHLSKIPNAFELVVIDDTDAFIHFYKEKMVIASTLHIKERSIVWEFREIYDKMLKNTDKELIYDCSEVKSSNIGQKIADVTKIFNEKFHDQTKASNSK